MTSEHVLLQFILVMCNESMKSCFYANLLEHYACERNNWRFVANQEHSAQERVIEILK